MTTDQLNLSAIRDLGIRSLSGADEFAVLLDNHAVFFTGGWDGIDSLKASIQSGDEIEGSFTPCIDRRWVKVNLNKDRVTAIVDLRRAGVLEPDEID